MNMRWDKTTISAFRKSLGLTLKGLADQLGVSEATVSRWEAGLNHPTFRKVERLDALARKYKNEFRQLAATA